MNNNVKLTPNELAFIALTNEYCHVAENCGNSSRHDFIGNLLKLLPRIYISAFDLPSQIALTDTEIDPYLSENQYDEIRNSINLLLAQDDVYLEVFEEDMKYSDTPIAVSISENVADLYQEFFNIVASVKDKDTSEQQDLLSICKENFNNYWGQTLCNVLRALHNVYCADLYDENELEY